MENIILPALPFLYTKSIINTYFLNIDFYSLHVVIVIIILLLIFKVIFHVNTSWASIVFMVIYTYCLLVLVLYTLILLCCFGKLVLITYIKFYELVIKNKHYLRILEIISNLVCNCVVLFTPIITLIIILYRLKILLRYHNFIVFVSSLIVTVVVLLSLVSIVFLPVSQHCCQFIPLCV